MPNLSRKTIGKWFQNFRSSCDRFLNSNPILMEGDVYANEVIEIDESIFGKRRKYNKGKAFRQVWVFGLVQKESRQISLHMVEDRKKATLIPLINENVKQGSKIYHDDWASYRKLHEYGYLHGVVTHSKEFKSKSGVCTNTIEGVWGDIKTKFRAMHGVRMKHLGAHLQEYRYRYMWKDKQGSIYNSFLDHYALHW